jgi:hypothetical protein
LQVILHLAATGSSVLRTTLIALHSSGFTAGGFARASVNSLYEITAAERNTLQLSEFLSDNGDRLVVGQPFPVQMVTTNKQKQKQNKNKHGFSFNPLGAGASVFRSEN